MRKAFLISCLLGLCACAPATAPRYDVLIVGGKVYDGSLEPGRVRNIGIVGVRIQTLDAAADADALVRIDAQDLIVTPGFIDPHTHATRGLRNPLKKANLNYLKQGVTTVFIGNDGAGVSNRDDTLATFSTEGIGSNVAFFSGHGAIRRQVMGSENRAPTTNELAAMKERVAADMELGAVGLSTGLYYVPGNYATTDEVIALASVAEGYGGVYDTHLRDESSYDIGLLAAIDETIAIARSTGIPVHISHIKALGQDVWGQSEAIIGLIDAARAEGLSVTANQYPWRASGTRFSNALIPRWALADSKEHMLERLADAETGAGIRDEMRANLRRRGGADAMLVTTAESRWRGQTLTEIAAQMEIEPIEAAIRVVLAEDPSIASFVMNSDDIARLAQQPWVMTGSDGSPGHPRLYGTYPKAWQDFVATELLSIPQFVHRSAGLVADTFSLCGRGYLREGYIADIAVIDPASYTAHADYVHPTELSEGVRYLLVNGAMVIANDDYTGALPGQILRRQDCAEE